MNLFDFITKPIFAKPKLRSCPSCGNRLDDLHIDLDNFSIKCPNCLDEFDSRKAFHDSDILLLAKYLPPDKRDQFLITHGFVKERANETPRWMVIGLITVLAFCGIVLGVMPPYYIWWRAIALPLVALALILLIIFYYRQEKKPKWKRATENMVDNGSKRRP